MSRFAVMEAQMEALRASLAAALPGRVVSRSMKPATVYADEDLRAGVVSLARLGEKDFANYRGREADLGTVEAVLVGRVAVGMDADEVALERAELALAGEILEWLQGPMPAGVGQCLATGFRQSGQIEYPAGWVLFKLEVQE